MKDAYYFPHDANARHDPKIIMLRAEHGLQGIGRFWCLIEILREQENYTFDISQRHNARALKHELGFTNEEELTKFLNDLNEFSLIVNINDIIYSPSLVKRMQRLDAMKEKRREAGIKSGESRRRTSVQQRSTSVQQRSPKPEHLPTYSVDKSTELPTEKTNQVTNLSDGEFFQQPPAQHTFPASPPTTAQGFKGRATLPTTPTKPPPPQEEYNYPVPFNDVPAGMAFVPEEFRAEHRVLVKISENESYDHIKKIYLKNQNPECTVYVKGM